MLVNVIVGVLTAMMTALPPPPVLGFPSGAPPDVCSTNLMPIHGGNQPVHSQLPYTVTASSRLYSPNKPITVVIKGLSGSVFKGFVIQAQDAQTRRPINSGEWGGSLAKELPCAAATHINDVSKNKVELTWTPKGSGEVSFVATIVESFDTFYTNIKSTTRGASSSSNSFFESEAEPPKTGSSGSSEAEVSRPSSSNPKGEEIGEDDEEVANEAAFVHSSPQDQFQTGSFHQFAPSPSASSSFSQPEVVPAAGSDGHSVDFFHGGPHFSPFPFAQDFSSHNKQQQQQQPEVNSPEAFANFPSQSAHAQRFVQPQAFHPFQEAPWGRQPPPHF